MKRFFALFLAVCMMFCFVACDDEESSSNSKKKNYSMLNTQIDYTKYAGDLGGEVSAEFPYSSNAYMAIKIENVSNKKITAVKLYSVSYDGYGEVIGEEYFDLEGKEIPIGKSVYNDMVDVSSDYNSDYGFISPTTVDVYVYSVYFEDGTEWGNRNAKSEEIIECCSCISIDNNSEIN